MAAGELQLLLSAPDYRTMWRALHEDPRLVLTCALIAAVAGFLAGSQWADAPDLREENARLRAELNQSKLRGPNPMKGLWPRPAGNEFAPATAEQIQPTLPEDQTLQRLKDEVHQRGLEAWVARTATENADEYTSLLSEFGLEPEAVFQVQSNLVELHEKANVAGTPMLDLAVARSAYDERMRTLLSRDDYERYRAYEVSKPARREYELLAEYALTKHGVALNPDQRGQVVALIQQAGATTTETWHGPYDPLPRPAAGRAVIDQVAIRYDSLVTSANSLIEAASASGAVDEEHLTLLQEYYADKVQEAFDKWMFVNRPADEIRAQVGAGALEGIPGAHGN